MKICNIHAPNTEVTKFLRNIRVGIGVTHIHSSDILSHFMIR